jgi:Peptidase family M1 domain
MPLGAGVLCWLLLGAGAPLQAQPPPGSGAALAAQLREISLDPQECYRVRDLSFSREDARFFFTDGYLIFAKPLSGAITAAVFSTDVEGGDAEVLLMPPLKSERRSLAAYTKSPNLNEHFRSAALIFSDDTGRELQRLLSEGASNKKAPDRGILLAEAWDPVLRNIAASFSTRLLLDVLSGKPEELGFFAAAIAGRDLGNFDVYYDRRNPEQLAVGQIVTRQDRTFYDIWASFPALSYRRGLAGPRTAEFTLADFRIEASLNADLLLDVVTRVKLTPSQPLRVLPFDVSGAMEITATTINGQAAEVVQRESLRSNLIRNSGNDLFLVVPSAPLEPGRAYEIEFRHKGRVVSRSPNGVYFVGARGNWYPNRGLNFTTYDLTFRYPKELDLVATGELVGEQTEGEWTTVRRQTSSPVRMAAFNLGRYDRVEVERDGFQVEVFANRESPRTASPPLTTPPLVQPPWSRRRSPVPMPMPVMISQPRLRMEELAAEIASSLEFMSARFGPSPLRSLAVSPVPGTFGQGFPGLIYLSTLSYLRPDEKAITSLEPGQQTFFTEMLHAHETAHQWWGNVVVAETYHDAWLMEALANYSALLHLEKRRGARAVHQLLEEYRDSLSATVEGGQTVESTGPISLGSRLETSLAPQAFRSIIYGKGSWILHMLRRQMGDERFAAMLRALRTEYEWKALSIDGFRRVALKFMPPRSSDPQLESFFEQWVYGTGIPAVKLAHAVKGKTGAWRLSGTLTQSGVEETFSAPVPVEIHFARGKSITHWLQTSDDPVTFSLPFKERPVRVVLDPGYALLRK